eukprot:GHVR01041454.1.p1 GENE.GHVR01041454.1~~GHVR01041454.1.p1  ORF type:complete len:100 (-),score=32.22 GHVR01041454.1:33-332(-)
MDDAYCNKFGFVCVCKRDCGVCVCVFICVLFCCCCCNEYISALLSIDNASFSSAKLCEAACAAAASAATAASECNPSTVTPYVESFLLGECVCVCVCVC